MGKGAEPPKQKYVGDCNGVPWSNMKKNKICCGFNAKTCNGNLESDFSHAIGLIWYGGCFFLSKGTTKDKHNACKCDKGPFDKGLFP